MTQAKNIPLDVIDLGDRLRPHQWGGIALVVLGSAAIGLA